MKFFAFQKKNSKFLMKLYIWSFTIQNFKFEVSYFYFHIIANIKD